MPVSTDDLRIREIKELTPPSHLVREFPCSERASRTVFSGRSAIHRLLHGADQRLLVVIGPCSIHDPEAAKDYAKRLMVERDKHAKDLVIVMRVYFEKPRTTVGWKGLINDPELDGSFQINKGLRLARELLATINEMGLPAGCEYLDTMTPQYIADLVTWGAIGARTTVSQVHRELASGLSCPVGFKNGTDGNVRIAIDAIKAASQPHHFLSVTKGGHSAIVSTNGNEDCHIILRGGREPNYDAASIAESCLEMGKAGLAQKLMIDASHANSRKSHENQAAVVGEVANQIAAGDSRIVGIMIESQLVAGRQELRAGARLEDLTYGQSVTDGCIGWEDSVASLETLAAAVRERRIKESERSFAGK